MAITWKLIKQQFAKAEASLEFCWVVLVNMKPLSLKQEDFTARFMVFQDRLAQIVFDLQGIRDSIILEEKVLVKNKAKYRSEWFISRMRRLSVMKDGIDSVVAIAKAFGDAYAYFFYQNDVDLLAEHYSHQRIINHTAGQGERGELEFIKKKKHINGHFAILHNITNILRYGDFSFIDLKTLKLTYIGELKTSHVSGNEYRLNLSLLKRSQILGIKDEEVFSDLDKKRDRRERQIHDIAKFLRSKVDEKDPVVDFVDKTYSKQINDLICSCPINNIKTIQVSPGLGYLCAKFRHKSLFSKTFKGQAKRVLAELPITIDFIRDLLKPGTDENSIIMGGLLYNPDFTDKNTPGTVPLFWDPIQNENLKKLYFGDCFVISIFNPVHLINEIEDLGFKVESKYTPKKKRENMPAPKHMLQQFDLFISYVTNYLLTEASIVESLKQTVIVGKQRNLNKILIRMQQKVNTLEIKRNR